MPDRKSTGPRPRRTKLVRVEMRQTVAGPDGVLELGHSYDLLEDDAEYWIENRAAWRAEEQPSAPEPDAADSNYPGPWDQDDWWEGISLSAWAEWRDPEAWTQRVANWVPIVSLDSSTSYEEDRKDQLYAEAIRQLSDHLRTDVEGGRIVLGKPPDTPFDDAKPVSQDALFEILKAVDFSPMREDEVYFRQAWIELRVYRPGRFAPVAREAKSDHLGPREDAAPSASAEEVIPWGTLETRIIDEYQKLFEEKNPPETYASYAILIKERIAYGGDPGNIERRLRMLRKEGRIESIK